jgi:hypothetical protein
MEYIITGIIFGWCLFILPLWAYRRGLQDGLALNKGVNTLEPIKGPWQSSRNAGKREKPRNKTTSKHRVGLIF